MNLAAQVDQSLDGLGHERARLLGVGEAVRARLGSSSRPSTSTSTTQASPRSWARIVTTGRPYRLALRTKSSRGSGSAASGRPPLLISGVGYGLRDHVAVDEALELRGDDPPGRLTTRTSGVLTTPSLRSIAVPTRWWKTSMATKPTFTRLAPACASVVVVLVVRLRAER